MKLYSIMIGENFMKRTIRRGVFETNSSSSHSLTIKKMSKDEKNIVDENASFEIRSPLAKTVQMLGLIENAENDYYYYIYYLDQDEEEENNVRESIVNRIRKINPSALNGYDVDKISYYDIADIFLKLYGENADLYDFFEESEGPYSLAFTVYNRNRAVVRRFATALLEELAKLMNITVAQASWEIEQEAFGNSDIRKILMDESTAEAKLQEYVKESPEFNKFSKAYKESGEADIVGFAKKFYIEDMQEFKRLVDGKISCEIYFCNGCLNDCDCGFESYYDMEKKLGLDFYMSDEEIRAKARELLTSYKFSAREMYCGLIFEQSGDIY